MTAPISIATTDKKRSKRTAKGLILTGAKGKKARRDGRHEEYRKVPSRRPEPDADFDIAHSLAGGLIQQDYSSNWSLSRNPRRSAHTTESSNFVCSPAKPRISRRVLTKLIADRIPQEPQYDEAGRPIVYKTDDAWSLPKRRR